MSKKEIRVAIIEDDPIFRNGIVQILQSESTIQVVGQYSNGVDGITGIVRSHPDITLLDLGLSDISGLDVIKAISESTSDTDFLVSSSYDDDEHLFSALKAGAIGYIVKNEADFSEVISAINEIAAGGSPMSLSIARRVISQFREDSKMNGKLERLTKRELEILGYVSKGFNSKKIAQTLQIGYETVRCHQKHIYKKLQVNSIAEAAAAYRGINASGVLIQR